uniref:Uncharacterized protein n=1 Tax=Rhizophora mucronata TaxID=61149 RepID=A0A2P2PMY9_RHIMU
MSERSVPILIPMNGSSSAAATETAKSRSINTAIDSTLQNILL